MKKKVVATLLCATMAIGLLAGCGAAKEADSEGGEASEKVFRYAIGTEPTTLDPTKGNSIGDNEIQHAITEGLVRNTAGDVQPGSAESWDISDDGLEYTFHLRDGLKWSDGEPLTAKDYEYGWKRLMNPETGSIYAFIGEYIKNGLEVEKGEKEVDELAVKAVDDQTLEVTLERPTPYFLSLIGSSAQFAPLREDVVEEYGTDFAATADKNVYSGPFVLSKSEDNEYVFEKNKNYWNIDKINLDRVEITLVEKPDTQLSMYEAGDLDYVLVPSAYVPDYKDKAETFMNGNTDYCLINHDCDNKALQNKNFRLALNYALSRKDYNQLANSDVYNAYNRLVFCGLTAGDSTYGEEYEVDSYPMEGDQDKAKDYLDKALKELGYSKASDVSVEIVTADAETSKKSAEVLQNLWTESLGIDVKIRQVSYTEMNAEVFPKHDFEIGMTGWGPDYDDPYTYLELFKSNGSYNHCLYSNKEFDKLLEASQTETDQEKRMQELCDAEQIILDDGAFVPLQTRNAYYMTNEKVKGLKFYFCAINIDWVYADIEE
ncbi:MAG: peptide ABC transporter substrate-binding protein [Lachnospiraceae bacterium]|nr:peptide ABC transporter substrate-binding protein [Lachnospiraceae bacterium]